MARAKAIVPPGKIIDGVDSCLRNMRRLADKAAKYGQATVVIGYRMSPQGPKEGPYAIYVHEDLTASHKPPTQAKFLIQPFMQLAPQIVRGVAAAFRSGTVTMVDALMAWGWRIWWESKQIVPVDTGALRNSAFVKSEGHGIPPRFVRTSNRI